jgi:hypothetical protein
VSFSKVRKKAKKSVSPSDCFIIGHNFLGHSLSKGPKNCVLHSIVSMGIKSQKNFMYCGFKKYKLITVTKCTRTLTVSYSKKRISSLQNMYLMGTLTKRPRTERPMDFSSQKFCNETFLGQNGPWDKAVLEQNILSKFVTKRPYFQGQTVCVRK